MINRLFILSTVFLLQCVAVRGQGIPLTAHAAEKIVTGIDHKERFHFCQESKVGFGVTAAGIITGCVGIVLYSEDSRNYNPERNRVLITDSGVWLVGGVVAILGSVLCIDGSIHDMHRFYKDHKLSILSNKANQVGLAYNF